MIMYNKPSVRKYQNSGVIKDDTVEVLDKHKKPLISKEELAYRLKYGVKSHPIVKNQQITEGNRSYESKQNRDYRKYLDDKDDLEKRRKLALTVADVGTDVMQLGNFIPHPIAQSIGKAGAVAGASIDSYQAYNDYSNGNYTSAAINAGSALLPAFLTAGSFRRNSKYLNPGDVLYGTQQKVKNAQWFQPSHTRVDYLTTGPKVKGMSNTNLYINRALLGGVGAETIYDAKGTTDKKSMPVKTFQSGAKISADPTQHNINAKYPAFKNMGDVVFKSDTAFTREKTDRGSIEYFSPAEDRRHGVTYDNGYKYPHPAPGKHGIVYNPNENTEQDIMLDMLHGLPVNDIDYAGHRKEFADAMLNSKYKHDLKRQWNEYNLKTKGKNDGYEAYKENWVDENIRALMFEGTPEDFQRSNYRMEERVDKFEDPAIKKTFTQLQNYLQVGKGHMLPQVNITGKRQGGILYKK